MYLLNGKEAVDAILAGGVYIPGAIVAAGERSGFENRTDSTLAFADGSRTLTISPVSSSFDIYRLSEKRSKTSAEQIVIPDEEGTHWIYYDSDWALAQIKNPTHEQTEDLIMNEVLVAAVYWNATENKGTLFEERHGMGMPAWTHRYLHETIHCSYGYGLALGDFVTSNGADNEDAQFSIAVGECYDEDIGIEIAARASTVGMRVYYGGASGKWSYGDNAGYSFLTTGTGRMAYDNAGSITEVTDGKFALTHVFAWNAYDANQRLVALMGDTVYSNANQAREGAETELSTLFTTGLPSAEMKPIATVIFQTADAYGNDVNTRHVLTDQGDNYVDWRSNPLAQGVAAADHGALGGLADDDHAQYLLVTGARPMDASAYLNWGATQGSGGYGLRDNSGAMEHKHSGGDWNRNNALVDRGDPTAVDYAVGALTTDGNWNDLDLSSIVPAGAVAVKLLATIQDDAVGNKVDFRENGNSNAYNLESPKTIVAGTDHTYSLTVFCDSSRVIEYRASNTTWTKINLTVQGWWI
jgi:hypothetical protein